MKSWQIFPTAELSRVASRERSSSTWATVRFSTSSTSTALSSPSTELIKYPAWGAEMVPMESPAWLSKEERWLSSWLMRWERFSALSSPVMSWRRVKALRRDSFQVVSWEKLFWLTPKATSSMAE